MWLRDGRDCWYAYDPVIVPPVLDKFHYADVRGAGEFQRHERKQGSWAHRHRPRRTPPCGPHLPVQRWQSGPMRPSLGGYHGYGCFGKPGRQQTGPPVLRATCNNAKQTHRPRRNVWDCGEVRRYWHLQWSRVEWRPYVLHRQLEAGTHLEILQPTQPHTIECKNALSLLLPMHISSSELHHQYLKMYVCMGGVGLICSGVLGVWVGWLMDRLAEQYLQEIGFWDMWGKKRFKGKKLSNMVLPARPSLAAGVHLDSATNTISHCWIQECS